VSYAKTDREKLLVLQIQHESLKLELMEAKAKLAAMDARRAVPNNKASVAHLIDIIKILLTVIVVMAGYKLGVKL